ncbi:TonB-dependent receptor, partial [Phenylobacterium sp.]|uniref:TonB-dependent receptor n=1 Tax=Phenylobacterium sp. TaxID=1871053 RepID=UPI002F41565C
VCNSALKLRAAYTPQNKYNLSVRYHILQGDETGDLSAGANYVYQTAMSPGLYSLPGTDYMKGYGLLSASIDWDHIMGSRVSGALFGTNLGNQDFTQGIYAGSVTLGFVTRVIGEPTMYGVRLKYDF